MSGAGGHPYPTKQQFLVRYPISAGQTPIIVAHQALKFIAEITNLWIRWYKDGIT